MEFNLCISIHSAVWINTDSFLSLPLILQFLCYYVYANHHNIALNALRQWYFFQTLLHPMKPVIIRRRLLQLVESVSMPDVLGQKEMQVITRMI